MISNKYNFDGDAMAFGMPRWGINKRPFPEEFPDRDNFPYGYLLQEEAEMLLEHARGKELVVELGTFYGLSASIMSLTAKRVITVDIYKPLSPFLLEEIQEGLYDFKNIQLVDSDADEFAKTFSESPDLVFIDANHEYEFVKDNFMSWFPLVKIGGEILFHDYQAMHLDIRRFVEELFMHRGLRVIDKKGTIIAFEKVDDVLQ